VTLLTHYCSTYENDFDNYTLITYKRSINKVYVKYITTYNKQIIYKLIILVILEHSFNVQQVLQTLIILLLGPF